MSETAPNAAKPSARFSLSSRVAALVVALALVGGGLYEWLVASRYEETDNAYVHGDVVQITPRQDGAVAAILADDTDFVRAGQVLIRLDAADARLALERAEAVLARTVREVNTLYTGSLALSDRLKARRAEALRAAKEAERLENEARRAAEDLRRRQPLETSGAVSEEDLYHARSQVTSARGDLAAAQASIAVAQASAATARDELASNRAMTGGVDGAPHPRVMDAAASVRQAWLALRRVELRAPVDGHVARRTAQLGQHVTVGAPLMTVTPLDRVWVEANFKEVQLGDIRIGQPVELTADMYGGGVRYSGRVAGLGAGTGATFAVLPAQNATGNWVKVVQRVPVRIALDPESLRRHPLMIGLSMSVRVDTSKRDGQPLAAVPRADAAMETTVFETLPDPECEARIARIVADNLASDGQ
ncbi:MAG: HlyD family efflux transporter periplasmic adaptor subunit [Azoarcus sp.]|nr:HlyD family efflux transporter periplasmic adaptor subunit [Azoarcus sp.]